jgi:outer membrane protein, heavy metal efflux system
MMPPSIRWATLLLSALAASCAQTLPYQATQPPTPAIASPPHSWDSPALGATLTALGSAPLDPQAPLTSTEALAAALTFNPELELQRAQLAVARAEVLRARQRPNPVLSLSPEHLLGAAAGGISPWVIALSLVWPVRTAGKRDLEIEQALATSDASLLNGAATVWALRTSVRGAVCAFEIANARRTLAEQEAALRADLAVRLGKQADAGIASRYDAMRSQLERDQSLQRLRQTQLELSTALHDLSDATGLPASEIARRQPGGDCARGAAPTLESVEALQERAIASRLDLRAGMADYRAADAAFRTELRRRIPDLNLGPGYTYDQGDRRVSFVLSGELPIFSHNDAGIARAAADRDRVIAQLDKLQWSVHAGVERALDQLHLAQQQFEDSQRVVREAQELMTRDRERRASGELDQPAVIASELIELSARLDSLTVARSLADATTALETAVQAPLAAPFFDGAAAAQQLSPHTANGNPDEVH